MQIVFPLSMVAVGVAGAGGLAVLANKMLYGKVGFGEERVEKGSRAKTFAGEVGCGQTSVYGADRGFYRSFGECGVGFGKEFPPLRSFRFFGGDCVFDGADYGR